jgi:proline iminopeptidase
MPHAELNLIADAGHAYTEPGILNRLLELLDTFTP